MAHRFTGQPREVMPGRNANLGLSIGPRRNPIFAHSASEKTELTPFAGYGFSQQEPSFSTSQVIELNGNTNTLQLSDQTSNLIRKAVREQMEKQTLREDTNKKLINTSQAQINDLKERFVLVEKTLANSTQEIYANIQGGINEVVKQITEEKWKDLVSKMRTVLEKEEEVLLKKVERKFAPISLINDLDMTIERVDALENQSILREEQASKKGSSTTLGNSSVMPANLQLRLAKYDRHEKEIDNCRKELAASIEKIQTLQHNLKQFQQQHQKVTVDIKTICDRMKRCETEIPSLSSKMVQFAQQNQIAMKEIACFQQNQDAITSNIFKLCPPKLTLKIEQAQAKKSLMNQVLTSGRLENAWSQSGNQVSTSATKMSEQVKPQLLLLPNEQVILNGRNASPPSKQIYLLDFENYLLDCDGKYLVNERGELVRLTQEQIDRLKSSADIEFIQCS